MPHAIIEYSANIAPISAAVKTAHQVMIASGLFSTPDIKTRAYATEDFLVGEKGSEGRFVHVTIYLLEGRTGEQKKALTEAMRDALAKQLANVHQLSVDIRDMSKDTYRKQVNP